MQNQESARILFETADLMEIAGEDAFRIRSYRNAASAVLAAPEINVANIHGLSKCLVAVLQQIESSGSCQKRDELLLTFPPVALVFLKIRGLGPKRIALIFGHFRISTIDELEHLCRDQKLRAIPRMGAKLEDKVLRSIVQYRQPTAKVADCCDSSDAVEIGDVGDRFTGNSVDEAQRQLTGCASIQGVILAIRKKLRLSQTALAKQVGVDQTTISQYETGKAKPSAHQLIKFLGLAYNEAERRVITGLLEGYGLFPSDIAMSLPNLHRNHEKGEISNV